MSYVEPVGPREREWSRSVYWLAEGDERSGYPRREGPRVCRVGGTRSNDDKGRRAFQQSQLGGYGRAGSEK